MAFQGELKTFPLPDLISWLDGARRPGRLTLICGGGDRVMSLGPGVVESFGTPGLYGRIARICGLAGLLEERQATQAVERIRAGASAEEAFSAVGVQADVLREICREEAFQVTTDLFENNSGAFHFSDEADVEGDEAVTVDIALRELIYEAARRLDEAAAAEKSINDDSALFVGEPPKEPLNCLFAATLAAVRLGSTVGGVRLALGMSRSGTVRLLQELWRKKLVTIEGAREPKPDPLSHLLQQGQKLLADEHFEAASLVFNSLLAADPADRRVREFAHAVERDHVDALYRKLSPVSVPRLLPQASLAALRPDERIVAAQVNGRWDVSTLVLASPLRELPTLKALERMVELGLATLA